MRQAIFVAAYDSQLKWCARIRDELVRRGFAVRAVVPDGRSALSAQQIADAGFAAVERMTWPDLLDLALDSAVLVSALAGPATKALTMDLAERAELTGRSGPADQAAMPVVVSGWVGVIIEKLVAGYLDRCGTDVVAVNSTADLRQFSQVAERLRLPTGNLLLAGLPFLSGSATAERDRPIRRVLYADQPTVPARETERTYVYRQLIAYARAHPDRQVALKPRHRPDEDTFHRMRYHPAALLSGVELPDNFTIDYTPIHEQLTDTDLLLTMSSTACLEAIDHGCRVALVLDLGIHERLGNQVFLDSGLLRTFSQITRDEIGTADAGWRDEYFLGRATTASEAIADRIETLLITGERPAEEIWQTDYFQSAAAFHRQAALEPTPAGSRALRRRIAAHGPVVGSAVHLAHAVTPPVLTQVARRAARRVMAGR